MYFIVYESFSVAGEADGYALHLGAQVDGNMTSGLDGQTGQCFSTFDVDNDADATVRCARVFGGGWWYGTGRHADVRSASCGTTNLNANSTYFYWSEFPQKQILESRLTVNCTKKYLRYRHRAEIIPLQFTIYSVKLE